MYKELIMACVLISGITPGVVVTSSIIDKTDNNREWFIVETLEGAVSAYIEELEPIACSSIENLNEFENIDYIEFMLSATVVGE